MVDITNVRKKLTQDQASRDHLQTQLTKQNKKLENFKLNGDYLLEVRALFQTAAQQTQQKLEYHISNLVTTALSTVFEDPYEFQVEFVQKRGKTEAELWFVREGQKINPIDASGGGAVDIASFALRVAFWSLTKKTRPLFILDEPFKHLSNDLQSRASSMLKMLSEKLNIQILMISHIEQLIDEADKEFKVVLKNGKSNVTSVL